uniref:Uncharacterized protein n=1 Tax=Chrysemys picta bellii TaxID=8478 RepID=A0A8C3IHJ8_CHRPI
MPHRVTVSGCWSANSEVRERQITELSLILAASTASTQVQTGALAATVTHLSLFLSTFRQKENSNLCGLQISSHGFTVKHFVL